MCCGRTVSILLLRTVVCFLWRDSNGLDGYLTVYVGIQHCAEPTSHLRPHTNSCGMLFLCFNSGHTITFPSLHPDSTTIIMSLTDTPKEVWTALFEAASTDFILVDQVDSGAVSDETLDTLHRAVRRDEIEAVEAQDQETIHESLLIRWTDIDAAEVHRLKGVRNVLGRLTYPSHPNLAEVLDCSSIDKPETDGIVLYYTVDGIYGQEGSLCDIFNHAWPQYLPEEFVWWILAEAALTLSFLHRGFRTLDQPADPANSVALCSQNLLKHLRVSLVLGKETSAYPHIKFTDYTRALDRASFAKFSTWDSNGEDPGGPIEWYHENFEDVQVRDMCSLGELAHVLTCQRDLDRQQNCVCPPDTATAVYSEQLLETIRLAAKGLISAEDLARVAEPIAKDLHAKNPDLKMSDDVPRLFAGAWDRLNKDTWDVRYPPSHVSTSINLWD